TRDRFAVHHDVARVVDAHLRGHQRRPEIRERGEAGEGTVHPAPAPQEMEPRRIRRVLRVFPDAISEERLERATRSRWRLASIARSARDADLVLTLRTYAKRQPPKLRDALARELPVRWVRNSSLAEIEAALIDVAPRGEASSPHADTTDQIEDVEAAARSVI